MRAENDEPGEIDGLETLQWRGRTRLQIPAIWVTQTALDAVGPLSLGKVEPFRKD
jgi:hypothetical protein